MLPTLYVSHGSPALVLMDNQTTSFFKTLAKQFDTPKYIVVISAHWITKGLRILSNEHPSLIYDFYNFPKELYEEEYPASNDIQRVDEIVEYLKCNNMSITKDEQREGYDHGVWSPLKLIYPHANIPVLEISLPMSFSPDELMKLGFLLSHFKEDTLIISSGSITHNLGGINWYNENAKPEKYAKAFRDWVVEKLEKSDVESLLNFKDEAPFFFQNHPTPEHFLPLFVTLGASKNKVGKSLHDVYMYGNLSMDTIIFKE